MTHDEFKRLRIDAEELHQVQGSEPKISLDAIFIALAARAATSRRKPAAADKPAPPWFADALTATRGSRLTIAQFLMGAGQFPVTRSLALDTGRWLREAGRTSQRRGGKLLFDL